MDHRDTDGGLASSWLAQNELLGAFALESTAIARRRQVNGIGVAIEQTIDRRNATMAKVLCMDASD
jgi:hypothetical protein